MGFLGLGGKSNRRDKEGRVQRLESPAKSAASSHAGSRKSPSRENLNPNLLDKKQSNVSGDSNGHRGGRRQRAVRNEAVQLRRSFVPDRRKSQVVSPAPTQPQASKPASNSAWSAIEISGSLERKEWQRLESLLWQVSTAIYKDQKLRPQILSDGIAHMCVKAASHPDSTSGVRQKAVYIVSQVSNLDEAEKALVMDQAVPMLQGVLANSSDSHTISSAVRALRNLMGGSEHTAFLIGREQCAYPLLDIIEGKHKAVFASKEVERIVIREATAALANLTQFGLKYQNQIIRANALYTFIGILQNSFDEETKYHATKALANCASESRWHGSLVELGAIVEAQRLLHSCKDVATVAEAARMLGNIGLTAAGRSKIVDSGGVEELTERIMHSTEPRTTAPTPDILNALYNICMSEKPARTACLRGAVPVLIELAVTVKSKDANTAAMKETARKTMFNIYQSGQRRHVMKCVNVAIEKATTEDRADLLTLREQLEDLVLDDSGIGEVPSSLEHLSRASQQVHSQTRGNLASEKAIYNFQPSGKMLAVTKGGGRANDISRGSVHLGSPTKTTELHKEQFSLGQVLGKGGFGTVYLAQKLGTPQPVFVAIKQFHVADTLQKNLAAKEQKIWEGLDHPNVVKYEGCFIGDDGGLNLVVEYIDGWSLARHLSRYSAFPEDLVAEITRQVLDGLEYLHANRVIHRDLKPGNVMVSQDGKVKITDFGVSSSDYVQTLGQGNAVVGTPWYIAPEMVEQRPYTSSVDIWSLGCTLLELATGKRPYHELNAMQALFRMVKDRRPPVPASISPQCRDFLEQCWTWEPELRPSASKLKEHPFVAPKT